MSTAASRAAAGEPGPGVIIGEQFFPKEAMVQRGARAASGLRELGIGPGKAVGLLLRNDATFIEAWLAAASLGAHPVPLNWHSRVEELSYILDDCGAGVVVAHSDLLTRFREAVEGRTVIVARTSPEFAEASHLSQAEIAIAPGATEWSSWLADFEPLAAAPTSGSASLMYTGGSTGYPKGVLREPRSSEQMAIYGYVERSVYGMVSGARTVVLAPLYHSAPLYHATAAFLRDGLLVIQPRFDPLGLLELIERHRITHLLMVPTMFTRLLRLPDEMKSRYDLSSLVHVAHGAAPCSPEIKRRMIEWWGPIIVEYYGCTESGVVTSADTAEWLEHPGTVGRAVPGAVVTVQNDEGAVLAPFEVGEVFVRNRGSARASYLNLEQQTREIERGSLITCGDVGYVDPDGFLFLLDRKKDMVISGGVNIFPAEIESLLITMPGVVDCAVVGIPDDDYGEVLAAAVVLDGDAAGGEERVRAWLADRLGRLKLPRVVVVLSELPRDPTGKLRKKDIRAAFAPDRG